MSRGGAAPYRKGAEFERKVQKAYEGLGWSVTRQPKSQSPYDLIAVQYEEGAGYHFVHLIQCKLAGKISKAEKEELVKVARVLNAVPVLVWKDGKILKRRNLLREFDMMDLPE
jgi:Holliday junction resolvase